MRISALKKHARQSLDAHWGKAIGIVFLILLANGLSAIAEIIFSGGPVAWYDIQMSEDGVLPGGALLASTLASLAVIPFTIGCYWFFLNLSRGENPQVSDTFVGYKNAGLFWKLIGAAIVQGIFVFLWSLLLIIPGIIKGFSYSQTFYILKDHPEMGILEAITESRQRMNGQKWNYFVLNISFIGWFILGICTFGIGLLFVIPYLYTTQTAFYQFVIADQQDVVESETEPTDLM